VKTFFRGDDVGTSIVIHIPADSDAMKMMLKFSYGLVVRVKCRLGVQRKESCVSLMAEDMEEIESVKVTVN
jgi:hypothetical protein